MPQLTKDELSRSESRWAEHLQDVLESNLFKNAPVLSGLLLYLWQNKDGGFSEYAIAVDALGRRPDFETKTDATVRVQISRLRKLLNKYYDSEGRLSPVRVVIPLGTHQIQLIEWPSEDLQPSSEDSQSNRYAINVEASASSVPTQEPPAIRYRLLVRTMAGTIVALLACIGLLLWPSLHRHSQKPIPAGSRLPAFWKLFSDNGKSFRLVLPVPTFFTWVLPNDSSLLVRDTGVNAFANDKNSDPIKGLEKRLGKPSSWQGYANLSDAYAALHLVRFLDSYGIRASISSSAESPQGIIDHENIVVFGTTTSLGQYQSYIDQLSYALGAHEANVIDKHLPRGSPAQFPSQHESASRSVQPGLIAFLPRGASGSRILILEGAQTSALISWLTSEDGLREIDEAERTQGKGPYFEAVVLSEVNGENPIQSRMVAFRPFSQNSR